MATAHVNNDFLKNILENHFNHNIEILSYIISDAILSGENFCSELKKIDITYLCHKKERHTISTIIKCFPQNGYIINFLRNTKIFDCEIAVYQSVLPEIAKFCNSKKVSPIAYYVSLQPRPILLLEDLSSINYKMLCKRNGLNMEHCLLVVAKLAYFHAASVVLHERDSSILPKFNKIVFRREPPFSLVADVGYDMLVKSCQDHIELQKYVNKLTLTKHFILNSIFDVHKTKSNLKVLNHGDVWTNNILFQYTNSNKLADVAFVDFQFSCYTSPCLDLHYFLATSPQLDAKKQSNIIIDHYFKSFIRELKKLQASTIPNRKEFEEDFYSFACFGFGASLVSLPICKASLTEGASVENYLKYDGENSFRRNCFYNDEYVKEMHHFMPYYDKFGIFDKLESYLQDV